MADTNAPSGGFTLRPPSQQMIDQRLNEQRFGAGRAGSLPFDPRTQDQRGPDAGPPPMAPITMEAEAQPSRVTGRFEELTPDQQRALSDPNLAQRAIGGVNQFVADSGLGALSRGFNDIVLALPDMAINAIASGLESAGIVEEGAVDRNFLNRVFNSSDYRTQRVIIPYVLNYGVDDYIGQTEAEGNFDQYLRAGGQGVGFAVPFIGVSARGAQLTAAAPNVINAAGQRVMPATASYDRARGRANDCPLPQCSCRNCRAGSRLGRGIGHGRASRTRPLWHHYRDWWATALGSRCTVLQWQDCRYARPHWPRRQLGE
jgi:hypothetical protein